MLYFNDEPPLGEEFSEGSSVVASLSSRSLIRIIGRMRELCFIADLLGCSVALTLPWEFSLIEEFE